LLNCSGVTFPLKKIIKVIACSGSFSHGQPAMIENCSLGYSLKQCTNKRAKKSEIKRDTIIGQKSEIEAD